MTPQSTLGKSGPSRQGSTDSPVTRAVLITASLLFLTLFLILPMAAVFIEALRDGFSVYLAAITDESTLAAIRLTLLALAIAVPLNTVFGIAAAWAITRFEFRGKSLLITLIDLPFAVSPVISGMLYVLLFGRQGLLGPFLEAHDIQVIFAVPGIVLATVFVTFPFVARELIPFMQSRGTEEDQAALVLGASGWQTFFRVTLPNIKWGLLYGVVLCAARAMGEFGAVSVVSGHIRGETNTASLHVEVLYNEYHFAAAFSVASILLGLSILTLAAKRFIAWRAEAARQELLKMSEVQEEPAADLWRAAAEGG
ncbi:MAG: sulfate ABC transporter permease subunit CysW [Byssovorax sp.]